MTRRHSTLGRVARVLLSVVLALVVFAGVGMLVLQTAWAKDWLKGVLVSQADTFLDGSLRVGALTGSVLTGLTLHDVSIVQDGRTTMSVDAISVGYDPTALARGRYVFTRLTISHPVVVLSQTAQGWNLSRLVRAPQSSGGATHPFGVDDLRVTDGSITVTPRDGVAHRVTGVTLHGAVQSRGGETTVRVDEARGRDTTASVALEALTFDARIGGDGVDVAGVDVRTTASHLTGHATVRHWSAPVVDLSLQATPIALSEVGRYVPAAAGLDLTPEVALTASGALTALDTRAVIRSAAGALTAHVRADVTSTPTRLDVDLSTDRLDAGRLLGRAGLATDITAAIQARGALSLRRPVDSEVTFTVAAPRAAALGYDVLNLHVTGSFDHGALAATSRLDAYGAHATIDGHATLPASPDATPVFSASGHVSSLSLEHLPPAVGAPAVPSDISAAYRVSLRDSLLHVAVAFNRSTLGGATISPGTTTTVVLRAPQVQVQAFSFDGTVHDVNLATLGRLTHAPALERASLEGGLNGTIHARGRGSSLATLNASVDARLTDSSVGGLHTPGLTISATAAGGGARILVQGPLTASAVPGAALPQPLQATGQVDVGVELPDLTHPFDLRALRATAVLALDASTIGGYRIEGARLNASLANGAAKIQELDVESPLGQATASGTAALAPGAPASNLVYTVDVPRLGALQSILRQPVRGAVRVQGTLTGPFEQPVATGTIDGHELAYGSQVSALTLSTSYTAAVPGWQFAQADVQAKVTSSFLALGGTNLAQVDAHASYRAHNLDVTATLEQQQRRLSLAGVLGLQPSDRRLTLRTLSVTTPQASYALPPAATAVVDYGGDLLTIHGLTLQHGAQVVRVDGSIARSGARGDAGLTLQISQLQVADLNAILLGTRKLTGVIDGSVRVTGSFSQPAATAQLTVTQAQVDDVPVQQATVQATYRSGDLGLDLAMQETAGGRLTATGTIPLGHPGTMDVHVSSTPLRLGFVQALTTAVDHIEGTGQFDLRATGTLHAPALSGTVTLSDVAMHVAATGVSYAHLDAGLRLSGEHLAIDRFTMEDDDHHVLRVSGGLDILPGAPARALNLRLTANGFRVLANDVGQFTVDADVSASGELLAPHVAGQIRVDQGRLDVDKVLEATTSNAYATTPATGPGGAAKRAPAPTTPTGAAGGGTLPPAPTPVPAPPPAAPTAPASTGGAFDQATVAVQVVMPSNVVLRAQNLQASSGPVGLGSMNLTLGGTIDVQKPAGQPVVLLGRLDVVRGYYDFQSRRFQIARGSDVVLRGQRPVDPELNVTADRDVSGVTTQVNVKGSLAHPQLSLSSVPPLSQSDILSLIVFNQPVSQLGEGQRVSLGDQAASLAEGAVAQPIATAVASALNLDQFEIQAPSGTQAGSVALGQQIGENVYIGFTQQFGSQDASVVSFEYRFSEALRLVTSIAQGTQDPHVTQNTQTSGIDLLYVIRY